MSHFLFPISIFLAAFVILYYDTLAHILKVMSSAEGSHGVLVLAVSLYLVWAKREHLRKPQKNPALVPGSLITAFGCLLLVFGMMSSTMLLQQISIIPTLLGAILLLGGYGWFRAFLVPVSYLIFLTGFVEEILGNAGIYLQKAAAWIGSKLLSLYGMPVLLSDTVIELPHIALNVVRACSGINHIAVLMALALPLALITQKSLVCRLILVAASFFIGIFANGLRVALIGIYALYSPGGPLHGPGETLYVSFIFFFGMAVLIALSHWLSKLDRLQQFAQAGVSKAWAPAPEQTASLSQLQKETPRPKMPFGPVVTVAAIFTAAFGLIHLYEPRPIPLKNSLQGFPTQIRGFIGKNLDQIGPRLRPFPADDELLRVYENGKGERLEVYIGYFETQTRERKVIDYRRDWMHEEAVAVPVDLSGNLIYINQTRMHIRNDPRTVFFWYDMGGRIVTSRNEGKLWTLLRSLVNRKTNAAVVVINSGNSGKDILPFVQELVSVAHAYLFDA